VVNYVKKYRLKIVMIKPCEFVDDWPRKPDEEQALEAFRDELLDLDAKEYFRVEVSEI